MKNKAITIILIFLLWVPGAGALRSNEVSAFKEITVYADQDRGPVRLYTGWLHGFEEVHNYPVEKIHALNTRSWRICKWWQQDHVIAFTDNIQYGVSFSWRWHEYGNPAEQLGLWEAYIAANVEYALDNNKHIAYWDIWNEPDHSYFWSWSYNDLLLTFKTAIEKIRELDPEAKVIGPSFAMFVARDNFNGKTTADFITDLYTEYGILLDAVSWHMNDEWYPWNIQGHVNTLKLAIGNIGGGYDPKLVINEHTQSLIIFRPVYLASFVWHMDQAGIDFSNLSCWNVFDQCSPPSTYSTCWAGMNGLFMEDYTAEQHSYWFYKWHGEEKGNKRLVVSELEINTFALASRNDQRKEIVICVGKHSHTNPIEDVTIHITGYPFRNPRVMVEIDRLPAAHQICDDNVWYPLQVPCPEGPTPVSSYIDRAAAGNLDITLADFEDSDLYFIRVKNKPVLADQWLVDPYDFGMGIDRLK